MSHLATRLFADRFADAAAGLPAFVPLLRSVLHGKDALPDLPQKIFDDTRDPKVCSMVAPLPDSGMPYPCVRVITVSVDYTDANPLQDESGTWFTSGTAQIAAQIIMRERDAATAATAGMYLLRAMRGVAMYFNVAPVEERTACGITLLPTMGIRQGQVSAPLGDKIVSPGALLITAPFTESLPFSLQ